MGGPPSWTLKDPSLGTAATRHLEPTSRSQSLVVSILGFRGAEPWQACQGTMHFVPGDFSLMTTKVTKGALVGQSRQAQSRAHPPPSSHQKPLLHVALGLRTMKIK